MRDYIYDLALVEEEIIITKEVKEPPLLWTCSTIRDEALAIWYEENTFTAEVYDCDAKLANDFEEWVGQRVGDFHRARCDITVQFDVNDCEPHWQNLRRWCKRIHGDYDVVSLFPYSDATHTAAVISAAHQIAKSQREQDWLECYDPLYGLRALAGIVDPRWLVDHDGGKFWGN